MSRGFLRLVALVVLVALGAWAWLRWPTESRRITQRLEQLAAAASFRSTEGNLLRLAKIQSVLGCFTADAVIRFETLGVSAHEFSGPDEIRTLLAAAQTLSNGLDVRLQDLEVTFGPRPETARVNLTASANSGKLEGFTAQEFNVELVKRERRWLIRKIEPVRTLRR